jgi:nitrate/nitrite transport system permease protein
MSDKRFPFDYILLPLAAMVGCVLIWSLISAKIAPDLPSPGQTWEQSKAYVLAPFAKRGELDQGILRFTWYSLILVAKGYALAIVIATPLGFLLGVSKMASRAIDPLIQILRPVSPLAWLPLGLLLFQRSEPAAVFTIAICPLKEARRVSKGVLELPISNYKLPITNFPYVLPIT